MSIRTALLMYRRVKFDCGAAAQRFTRGGRSLLGESISCGEHRGKCIVISEGKPSACLYTKRDTHA